MASAGQELSGQDGFHVRFVRTGHETGGELLEMDVRYGGGAPMPPPHLHPKQDEHFEVLEGAMLTIIGGEERRYAAGESFDVPAGTPHQMAAEVPSRIRWEVRPALRTAEFLERIFGGEPFDGPSLLSEHQDEIRFV